MAACRMASASPGNRYMISLNVSTFYILHVSMVVVTKVLRMIAFGYNRSCLKDRAPFTRRTGSPGSIFDVYTATPSFHGRKPATESLSDRLARNGPPLMSPMSNPIPRQSPVVFPVTQDSPIVSSTTISTGAFALLSFFETACSNDSVMMNELVYFSRPTYRYEASGSYDQSITVVDPIVTNSDDAMMSECNNTKDLGFSDFVRYPVGA